MAMSWAAIIKADIIDIKIRMSAIEAKLDELGAKATPDKAPEAKEDTGFGSGEEKTGDSSMDLVHATYTIRTASTSMRGYLMLLDQAGLNKDQKRMIRELEYGMMMINKAATSIKLFMLAQATLAAGAGPLGMAYLVFAGGTTAASMAYGMKLSGGMI